MGLIERDRIALSRKPVSLPVAIKAMQRLPEIVPPPPGRASPRRTGGGLLLIAIGLALGIVADRAILASNLASKTESAPRTEASQNAPAFSRVGDRIVVPAGS